MKERYMVKTKLRSIAAAMAVGVTAIGGSLLVTAPASAWQCSAGYSCVWRDGGFSTGGVQANKDQFQYYRPNWTGIYYDNTVLEVNNSISSVMNNGNVSYAYFYIDGSCNGPSFNRAPGGNGDSNLSDTTGPVGFNNALSSAKFSGQPC